MEDLVASCKLVDAMADAPLLEAFDKIVAHSILSVPIYSVEKQNYVGNTNFPLKTNNQDF